MENTKVSFLGEIYSFPEELQEYVVYMKEFEEMYDRLFSILTARIKRKWYDYPDEEFKEILHNEARRIISNLSSYDIYDVSLSDLIGQNKGMAYLDEMTKEEFEKRKQISIDAIRDYQERLENAQTHAASQITGSGMALISNSVLAHVTFSALESNTIKRQMNKADDEFKRTMKAVEYQNTSTKERRENDLLFKSTYPKYADVVMLFVSGLTEKFFGILEQNNVYQYSKVIPYNSQRSSELLDNIDLVDETSKKKVLIQAFQNCPYNANVYYKAIELNLADFDLISTIDTYEQRKPLIELLYENAKRLVSITSEPDIIKKYVCWLIRLEDKKNYEIWNEIFGKKIISLRTGIKKLNNVINGDFDVDVLYAKLCVDSNAETEKNIKLYVNEQLDSNDIFFISDVCGNDYIESILKSCNVKSASIDELKKQAFEYLDKKFQNVNEQKQKEKDVIKKKKKRNLVIVGSVIAIVIAIFVGKTILAQVKTISERNEFESLRSKIEKEIPSSVESAFNDNVDVIKIKVDTDFEDIESYAGQGQIRDNVTTILYLDNNCNFGDLSDEEKYDYISDQDDKMTLAIDKVKDKYSEYESCINNYGWDELNFYNNCDYMVDLSEEYLKVVHNKDTYTARYGYLIVNDESTKVKDN